MNIIIANQKSGAGKTTHCILFSNYLVLEQKEKIMVLDLNLQDTLKAIWDRDRHNYVNKPLYNVLVTYLYDPVMMEDLKGRARHVIIDLPGNVDDEKLVPVFKDAGLVICPFAYERSSYRATYIFSQVVRHRNRALPIVFLPNGIRPGCNATTRQQVAEQLSEFGMIAPEVSFKTAFQETDTLTISSEIREQLIGSYGFIYERYIKKVSDVSPL